MAGLLPLPEVDGNALPVFQKWAVGILPVPEMGREPTSGFPEMG